MPSFTLSKIERLKSKKAIDRLFSEGQSFSKFPFRIVYFLDKTAERISGSKGLRFTASVPKKNFPKAASRNRVKRKIKEAYRLNKTELAERQSKKTGELQIMFIYTAKEDLAFAKIEAACKNALGRLSDYIK